MAIRSEVSAQDVRKRPPFSRRADTAAWIRWVFLGLAEVAAGAASLSITAVSRDPIVGLRLEHESDPESYFVLYQGPVVTDLTRPVRLALGRAGPSQIDYSPAASSTVFLRLGRITRSAPLDLDGDGIDDVFELRHPAALDPLNPLDAGEDFDQDGVSNLAEYRAGTDPGGSPVALTTVYVVDDPAAGSTNQFHTLTNALAALNAGLPVGETGRVIVATDRPQLASEIDLHGGTELEAGEGYAGRVILEGPGETPLWIRAPSGCALRGIRVLNSGGLQLSAGRRLRLQANHLPSTVLTVGRAAALAGETVPHGASASFVEVGDCVFTGPLTLIWHGSAGADADLGITDNSASMIAAFVRGSFGGSAHIGGNIAKDVVVAFDALANAEVRIDQLANLESLAFRGTATGNPRVQFASVMAGLVSVELNGIGSLYAGLSTVNARQLSLNVGAANTEIAADQLTADNITLSLRNPATGTARLRHRLNHANVGAGVNIDAWEAEHGQIDLDLSYLNARELALRTRARTSVTLGEQVTLTGQVTAEINADVLRLDQIGARLEAGLRVSGGGVGAGITGFWQGGTVRGRADFECAYGTFVGLTIDGTVFDPGGALAIVRGGSESLQRPAVDLTRLPTGRAGTRHGGDERAIVLRNLTQGPGLVLIGEIDSSVTVENCSFQASGNVPALILEKVQGPVRVGGCQFQGQGIGISDCRGDAVLAGNQVHVASAGPPAIGVSSASATLATNIVQGSGLIGLALDASGNATIQELQLGEGLGVIIGSGQIRWEGGRIGGMATVTGARVEAQGVKLGPVLMIGEGGTMGFSEIDLAGTLVMDLNERGGLLQDPTAFGARPEEVYSSIDFDNDDQHCADYPPPQVRPDTGECLRPGVPAPR